MCLYETSGEGWRNPTFARGFCFIQKNIALGDKLGVKTDLQKTVPEKATGGNTILPNSFN